MDYGRAAAPPFVAPMTATSSIALVALQARAKTKVKGKRTAAAPLQRQSAAAAKKAPCAESRVAFLPDEGLRRHASAGELSVLEHMLQEFSTCMETEGLPAITVPEVVRGFLDYLDIRFFEGRDQTQTEGSKVYASIIEFMPEV